MSELQIIVFQIGTERYGTFVQHVQSIEKMLAITSVPKTLSFIKGVMNLRGVVVPVVDLRERFGFQAIAATDETRIVVVNVAEMTVGLIVDAVTDVTTFNESQLEPAPAVVGGIQAVYLQGVVRVGEQLMVLLNLERILSDAQVKQLEEVEKSVRG